MKDIKFAVLTVSDRSFAGVREDVSGPVVASAVKNAGWEVVFLEVVPDEIEEIKKKLLFWCETEKIDVILTTGGTGFAPRDVTPEATKEVIERETPGLCEAMRSASLKITPHAMLSRSYAGIRERVLIVNLPGSPKAALENFEVLKPVLTHAVSLLREDPSAEKGH